MKLTLTTQALDSDRNVVSTTTLIAATGLAADMEAELSSMVNAQMVDFAADGISCGGSLGAARTAALHTETHSFIYAVTR